MSFFSRWRGKQTAKAKIPHQGELPPEIILYRVRHDGEFRDLLCLRDPKQTLFPEEGIPEKAIIGSWPVMEGQELLEPLAIKSENFGRNPVFVELMHGALARYGPESAQLKEAARRQGRGWLYLIDSRIPDPNGDVPIWDILGALEIKGGQIVPDSYWANPQHVILSDNGPFRLPPGILQLLVKESWEPDGDFSQTDGG